MGNGNGILVPPDDVNNTLTARGQNYGKFSGVAEIEQQIKQTFRATPGWKKLAPDQQSALEMIAHKTARILNGNPDYIDSWHDIAGYAKLIENRLSGTGPA